MEVHPYLSEEENYPLNFSNYILEMKNIRYFFLLLIPLCLYLSCKNNTEDYPIVFNKKDVKWKINDKELKGIEADMFDKRVNISPVIQGLASDICFQINIRPDSSCYIRLDSLNHGDYNSQDDNTKNLHKTSYTEQLSLLYMIKNLCEQEYGVQNFDAVVLSVEHMGDLNAEISEIYDNIEDANHTDDIDLYINQLIKQTTLQDELKKIFVNYDIKFDNDILTSSKIPYSIYTTQHKLINKYNIPYVYPIDELAVHLENNTLEYKVKSKYKYFIYNIKKNLDW